MRGGFFHSVVAQAFQPASQSQGGTCPEVARALPLCEHLFRDHPADGRVECLDGAINVRIGVRDGEQPTAVEDINPLVDHTALQRRCEIARHAALQCLGGDAFRCVEIAVRRAEERPK